MSWIVWLLGIFILLGGFLNIGNLFFDYYSDDDESILKEKINFEDLADYHLTLGISLSFLGAWMSGYLQFLSYFLLILILYISYRSISIEKIKGSIKKIKVSKEKEVLTIEGSNEDTENEWAGFTQKVEKLTDLLAELGQRVIDFMSSTLNDYSNLKKRGFFLSSIALSFLIIVFNIGSSSNTPTSNYASNYDRDDMETYNIPGTSITTRIYSGEEDACPKIKQSLQSNANRIFKIGTKGMSKKEKRKYLDQAPGDTYVYTRCISCALDISLEGRITLGETRLCDKVYRDYQASVGIKWVDGFKVK